ncbi:hypothetical protein [Nonomuraea maritima]
MVMDRWLERATDPEQPPPVDVLREDVDQAIAVLAGGLDRP